MASARAKPKADWENERVRPRKLVLSSANVTGGGINSHFLDRLVGLVSRQHQTLFSQTGAESRITLALAFARHPPILPRVLSSAPQNVRMAPFREDLIIPIPNREKARMRVRQNAKGKMKNFYP